MTIIVESRRKKFANLEKALPSARIIDLTSKADEPWVRFSPFYPHGRIPVPNSPGVWAQSVEGLRGESPWMRMNSVTPALNSRPSSVIPAELSTSSKATSNLLAT